MTILTRALIVDDVPAGRSILAATLRAISPDVVIVEAASIAEAQPVIERRFDLALIDLGLPDGRGSTLIRQLKRNPTCITAAVTVMDDDPSIEDALAAGADGYLLKDSEPELLQSRIVRLLAGEPSLSPSIARRVLARFRTDAMPSDDPLSAREREVLALVARGLRATEAAVTLGISAHTVRDHIKSIYRKLDVSSRAEVTLEAQRRRLT
ncbi:MAG: response regulator transcription factor [Pseudomonadota bacterium]|nr:response regulator transcription factor [Pseudomonadota bacterium]